MKRIFIWVVAVVFLLSAVGFCLAANEFYRGTITKISGDKVTVKDDKGKIKTMNMNDGGITKLKVGDKVVVKEGKIIAEDDWERSKTPGVSTPDHKDRAPQPSLK